jgi:hypothetical protein
MTVLYTKINTLENSLIKKPLIKNPITKTKNQFEFKKYTRPSGKVINYQGYENIGLNELVQIYNEDDIINDRYQVPIINYTNKNKEHKYYPDIYIKSENKIIEIKSEWGLIAQNL